MDQADFEKKKKEEVNFGNLIKIVNYAKKKKVMSYGALFKGG